MSFKINLCISVLALITLLRLELVSSVSLEEDLTLTKTEKATLDKFRDDVVNVLPEAYMKDDIYLVRWLRARNFNLEQAKAMLFENLKWRKQNNMSTIHDEDWSDMKEDYPFFIDTSDKTGRPIATLKFGEWNVRRAVLTGRGPRLTRYLYKALDEITGKVRALQQEGKEVTQWISLLDMDGYSLITNGCIPCLQIYISYVTAYESYFPGSVHNIILINTPSIFGAVLSITRPLLGESTRNVLHVFGTNRQEWTEFLGKHIEAHFGGSKTRPEEEF